MIFTFVAIWHDSSMTLLIWGWLVIVAMLPEYLANAVLALPSLGWFRAAPYYRHARVSLNMTLCNVLPSTGAFVCQSWAEQLALARRVY